MSDRVELAILGAAPAFTEPLFVGRPNIGDRDKLFERFSAILDRRWLTNDGPLVREFESAIAEATGARYCVATCNGTIALEIAIRSLGLTGEVIVPSYTFVATAHALEWCGVRPVFCDIDPRTHNIDPNHVEELITPQTTGILGVHLWGRLCDVDALEEIASRRNLKLLYDGAHALLSTSRGRQIGTFGAATALSFHATKFVNSAEGGAIITNDTDLARQMRLVRNFGFAAFDLVLSLGVNGKMSELSAAMGLTSLESAQEFIRCNRENYDAYREVFADIRGLSFLEYDARDGGAYPYIVAEVDANDFGLTRDEIVTVLVAEQVIARRYFYPGCHAMAPYRQRDPDAGSRLPNTVDVARRVIVFPTGTSVGRSEIEKIADVLRRAQTHAARVREALSTH